MADAAAGIAELLLLGAQLYRANVDLKGIAQEVRAKEAAGESGAQITAYLRGLANQAQAEAHAELNKP